MYEARGAGWGARCENPGEKGVESLLEVFKERTGCEIFNREGSGRKKAKQKQKECSVSFRFFTPPSGRGKVIPICFLSYSSSSSSSFASDSRFLLGQTNNGPKLPLHHLGSYIEWP